MSEHSIARGCAVALGVALGLSVLGPPAAAQRQNIAACPTTFQNTPNQTIACFCARDAVQGNATVWGTDVYSDDSSICRAARHAGAIGSAGGGVIVVPMPGQRAYRATRRNGVATESWNEHGRSFALSRLDPRRPVDQQVAEAGAKAPPMPAAPAAPPAPPPQAAAPPPPAPASPAPGAAQAPDAGGKAPAPQVAAPAPAPQAAAPAPQAAAPAPAVPAPPQAVPPPQAAAPSPQAAAPPPAAPASPAPSPGVAQAPDAARKAPAPQAAAPAPPPQAVARAPAAPPPPQQQGVAACPESVPEQPLTCACSAAVVDAEAPVWGTDIYTADSSICRAARHAGAVGPEGGVVRVLPAPGQQSYAESERNGVRTMQYGSYVRSFRIEAPSPAAAAPTAPTAPAAPAPPAATK